MQQSSGADATRARNSIRLIRLAVVHAIIGRVPELWDATFQRSRLIWGASPTASALFAADYLAFVGATDVLIPGIGYGRNAKPFLERGMRVTGIETSGAAIALARTHLDLDITIHHGSALDMPFDDRHYDGVFCHILISLLDSADRAALLRKCTSQLVSGGTMIFTVISKGFEMYGRGQKLGEDWYEVQPGARMYFYDADSIEHEFGGFGVVDYSDINSPLLHGEARPFLNVICKTASEDGAHGVSAALKASTTCAK